VTFVFAFETAYFLQKGSMRTLQSRYKFLLANTTS